MRRHDRLEARRAPAGTRLLFAVGATAVLLVASPAGSAGDSPPDSSNTTLCLALAPDDSAIVPMTEIPASFRGFAVACRLREGEKPATLSARWIAVAAGTTASANTVIGTASVTLGARRHAGFRFTLPRDLAVGSYRVDVVADGKPWASVEVPVVADKDVALPSSSADLLPLAPGTTWTYAFRMDVGEGRRITLPGIEPDAAGTLRATATYKVAKRDSDGAHVEIRRGKDLVLEEWWAVDANGVSVARRRAGGDTAKFDPPQPLFPMPARGVSSSTWTPKGGAAASAQAVRTWGPVTVAGPAGPAVGWVVLLSLPADAPSLTIERQFVPGVGMVRETIVQTVGGELATRQEVVLLPPK